jgi:hypothetical protein
MIRLRETMPGLLALMALGSCRSVDDRSRFEERPRAWVVPAPDIGDSCSDVGRERVCWSTECASGSCRVMRVVPGVPALSAAGYRCAGSGPARVCRDRVEGAGPFACDAGACVQREPRMPDDGEWSCSDVAGVVVCSELARAAGSLPAPSVQALVCGAGAGARVCVDFSPDLPDERGQWRCRFVHETRTVRECRPGADPGRPGAECEPAGPCMDGLLCVNGRCLPERPSPSCATDRECPSGSCRFGTCRKGGS